MDNNVLEHEYVSELMIVIQYFAFFSLKKLRTFYNYFIVLNA